MRHESVLLKECVRYLHIDPAGTYVDGTLGLGGHAEAVLQCLSTGRLIGIDRDGAALEASRERLKPYGDKTVLVRAKFSDLGDILDELGIEKVNGMLFDLGVSSPQLDEAERGFSYMQDARLDMRMDRQQALTAREILNTWSEAELRSLFWRYGEERYSGRIAEAVVRAREKTPLETTGQFVEVIRSTLPAAVLREKQHPAKRCFQAVRMAVNNEMEELQSMLDIAPDRLLPGGRLLIISFESLEDRTVKEAIRRRENGCTCPPEFPVCTCGFVQTLKSVTRRPVVPEAEEIAKNPRARSAKLRVAERV